MIRASRIEKIYREKALRPFAVMLLSAGWKPNQVSISALALSGVSGVLFVFSPFWGGIGFLISGFLDTLDGEMSRRSDRDSRAGAFLDSVLDRYSDFFVMFGILLYYHRKNALDITGIIIIIVLIFGNLMVDYVQIRAESKGTSASSGLWERPERVLLIGLAGIGYRLVPPTGWLKDSVFFSEATLLGVVLSIMALGVTLMALQRLIYGYRKLERR